MKIKQRVVEWLGASYTAGPGIPDAIAVCRMCAWYGWSSTLCLWDGPRDTPASVASKNQTALRTILRENLDCYLSVKLPALGYDFEILKDLLERAREGGVPVHFDSQDPCSATRSFKLLERAVGVYSNVGCTLPARWRRSASDVERALNLKIAVRVVKGQWPDPASPQPDPQIGFLRLVDALAGRAVKVGVATHDAALAREALRRLQNSATPCELEQLFGLPMRAPSVSEPLGANLRLYVAWGHGCLPYSLSEMWKRPAIAAWILRDLLLGRRGKLDELGRQALGYRRPGEIRFKPAG